MATFSSFHLSTFALAGATALGSALAINGCGGDEFSSETDGGGDGGGTGSVVPGGQYIPVPVRPLSGQTLTPTRSFLLWSLPGAVPDGTAIDHYDVCWTTGAASNLGGESDCPNALTSPKNYDAIASLEAGANYFWKVRAGYTDGRTSAYSPAQSFATNTSLKGWWRIDEGVGTKIADASGNGNVGNLQNGAAFGPGINGQGLQCDGVDDYADIGNKAALQLNGPLTVSAWVKSNGLPTNSDTGILNSGTLNYALTFHINGQAYFYINDVNNLKVAMSPDVWHHLVGVFDATTKPDGMKLYKDGMLVATKASTTSTTGATGSFWIGRYADSYFRGSIDDVMVISAAVDDQSIVNDYCAVLALSGAATLPDLCH